MVMGNKFGAVSEAYRQSQQSSGSRFGPKKNPMGTGRTRKLGGGARTSWRPATAGPTGAMQAAGPTGLQTGAESPTAQDLLDIKARGGAIPKSPEEEKQSQLDQLYEELLEAQKASFGRTQDVIEQQGAAAQRRAAAINASLGRGIGGGFAGLAAQAQLGTQQALGQAKGQHERSVLGLKQWWLDRMLGERAREQDREAGLAAQEAEQEAIQQERVREQNREEKRERRKRYVQAMMDAGFDREAAEQLADENIGPIE